MRMRVGLLAVLMVMVPGTGVVAQDPSPSPEPPPWFGGRVEMPEHGFAVTLPDDWVGFDMTDDLVSQVGAASALMSTFTSAWAGDEAAIAQELAEVTPSGIQLLSFGPTSLGGCIWVAMPVSDLTAEEVALSLFHSYAEDPAARDVEPPRRIDLPAGTAYHVRMSLRAGLMREQSPSSAYALDMGAGVLAATCNTYGARPDDDWLSIVETIEFLPAEE